MKVFICGMPCGRFAVEMGAVPRVNDSISMHRGERAEKLRVIDVVWPIYAGDLPYPYDGLMLAPEVHIKPITQPDECPF